ncbi:MAG TPA: hypothetical protein VN788_16955 [Verrucomicrobiae bacterium]|nr:hypothetical protein [Verrucomicrobiae bacterium]
MFGDFTIDRRESLPPEGPAGANPVVAAMASPESLAGNEPNLEDRVVIEVDTVNPTPMTITIAEAIVFLLTNANRFAEPEPAPMCRRRRQVPTSQTPAPSQPEPALSHHARHCTICHHPERQAIDEEFTHWYSPKTIASDYAVGMRSVYRHARALGLFERRAANLREALGHIIEKVENARSLPTPSTRFTPMRTYRLPGDGLNRRSSSPLISGAIGANRHTGRVEHDATY